MKSYNYEDCTPTYTGLLAGLTYDALHRDDAEPAQAEAAADHPSWLDRLDAWFWKQELASREAWLAQATDIVDLEQRMRALERGPN
ncbi:MAG TPA: DUF3563 family protein [Casimicrobiaceae bacterium]|nr:DUF3563 family protein [Casimicrobiaceae bacterium]